MSPYDFAGRLHVAEHDEQGHDEQGRSSATPAVAETLVVEFTSATAFGVTGTVSGALGAGTLAAGREHEPVGLLGRLAFELGRGDRRPRRP